jgi:hypothetical protein
MLSSDVQLIHLRLRLGSAGAHIGVDLGLALALIVEADDGHPGRHRALDYGRSGDHRDYTARAHLAVPAGLLMLSCDDQHDNQPPPGGLAR